MPWPEIAFGLLLPTLAAGSLDGARRDRHRRRCPACRAAEALVASRHPEWLLSSEHRAAEPGRDVVAVFYYRPDDFVIPTPYLVIAVDRANGHASELPGDLAAPYYFRWVK